MVCLILVHVLMTLRLLTCDTSIPFEKEDKCQHISTDIKIGDYTVKI